MQDWTPASPAIPADIIPARHLAIEAVVSL